MRTPREAIPNLSSDLREGKRKTPCPASSPAVPFNSPPSLNLSRLSGRVVSFYHQTFCEDRRAMEYLKSRGIADKEIFADFEIGFSNGTLFNALPGEGEVWEALKEIGILNAQGREVFYDCAVFPVFDENQDCVDLYGRKITDGEENLLYLPGPRHGVFNCQAGWRLGVSVVECWVSCRRAEGGCFSRGARVVGGVFRELEGVCW